MKCKIESGGLHPLRHSLASKTKPAMGVLRAQKLKLMRSKIDHQETAGGAQHARGLKDGARAVVEEMQHLVNDDRIEGIICQREIVDVALAHTAMAQPRTV